MLAVALLPSNQNLNLGAIAGYTEAGGAQQIVTRVEPLLRAQGVIVRTFTPPLESQDDARHTGLAAMMRQARAWLDQAPALASKAAVHVHTNAGSTPEAGSSHTGYCWFAGCPGGRELGQAVAERVGQVLGLPVVAYDYSGLSYLADLLFAPLPSVILELTRHDRRADLERLYAAVDGVAAAIVDGLLAWAGQPVATDELAALRAENERLRAAITRARDALAAAGF